MNIFISYSSQKLKVKAPSAPACHSGHEDILKKLKSFLELHRFKVFVDSEYIVGGDQFLNIIKKEISECDVFLLMLNKESKKSLPCNQEIGFAKALKKRIIPVLKGEFRDDLFEFFITKDTFTITYNTLDDLCQELLNNLTRIQENTPAKLSLDNQPISDLVIMNLLGAWKENCEGDELIIKDLINIRYEDWIRSIQSSLRHTDSLLKFKNGIWECKDRLQMWRLIGDNVFDKHLDKFQKVAIEVLSERDPKLELPPEERYMAEFHNKTSQYSQELKRGLAETLALLGNHSNVLERCSPEKINSTVKYVVMSVLSTEEKTLWASLDSMVLPLLAESSPDEFMNAVEISLRKDPCPFDYLFSQETPPPTGRGYIYVLVQALEVLAWSEEHLTRATVLLGKLASRDPGGNYGPRPQDSLSTIFLPWWPQTMASWEKQQVAISTLQRETPEIAWKALLDLLPSSHSTSSGCKKPWSDVVFTPQKVTDEEYSHQSLFYTERTTEMALNDNDKLIEILEDFRFKRLTLDFQNKLIKHIEHHDIPEEKRVILWEKLNDLSLKQRKFSDVSWTLPKNLVKQIEKVVNKIAPNDIKQLYSHLFNKYDDELMEERSNYIKGRKGIQSQRESAIKAIFESEGIDAIVQFAQNVNYPFHVGSSLGSFIENDQDFLILKNYLKLEPKSISDFIFGFVQGKYEQQGWGWVDKLDTKNWTEIQKGQFLRCLPFNNETWKRAGQWLKSKEEYWSKVIVNPYRLEEKEFYIAIGELLDQKRPFSVIECLRSMLIKTLPLPYKQTIRALLEVTSGEESHEPDRYEGLDSYRIVQIIKHLQKDPDADIRDIYKVEFNYLRIFTNNHEISPKVLEQKLASEPEFFHEMISLRYRPKGESENKKEPKEKYIVVKNISYLFRKWKTPPGTQPDGSFSGAKFKSWLKTALYLCRKSGHLYPAEMEIGKVLIHSPNDEGLWIHRTIAEALNQEDAGNMMYGFSLALSLSRGVYVVDPTGKQERDLAKAYRKKAEDLENAGFHRFSTTLKELAKRYDLEAKSREQEGM